MAGLKDTPDTIRPFDRVEGKPDRKGNGIGGGCGKRQPSPEHALEEIELGSRPCNLV